MLSNLGFISVRFGSKWGHGASWCVMVASSWVILDHLRGSWGVMEGSWGHHGGLHRVTRSSKEQQSGGWGSWGVPPLHGVTPYMSGEPLGLGFGSSSSVQLALKKHFLRNLFVSHLVPFLVHPIVENYAPIALGATFSPFDVLWIR